jgi:hypothetical protein
MTMNLRLKKLLFAIPALMLFLLGCGPDVYVKDVDTTIRSPNTGQIDTYNSPDEVKRPYKTIQTMRVQDDRVAKRQDEEQMKQRAVDTAKESGADAIIITKSGIHTFRVPDGQGGWVTYHSKLMEIEAIVYTDK